MNKTIFDSCTLFISARSPFARRVRTAFLENGVSFTLKTFDVFAKNPELEQVNPLRRVPAVLLQDGRSLIDSHEILAAFYGQPDEKRLLPGPTTTLDAAQWSGLAAGFCDRTVERFLETRRPVDLQDPEILTDFSEIVHDVLSVFESQIRGKAFVVGEQFSQVDIDWACALTYLEQRYNAEWKNGFPETARFLNILEQRPHFIATFPPR